MSKVVLLFYTCFEDEIVEQTKNEFQRFSQLLYWGGVKLVVLSAAESCLQVQSSQEGLNFLNSDIVKFNYRIETLHLILEMIQNEYSVDREELLAVVGSKNATENVLKDLKIPCLRIGRNNDILSVLELPQRISSTWKRLNKQIVRVGHIMKLSRETDLAKRGFFPIVPEDDLSFFPVIMGQFHPQYADVILHKATDQLIVSPNFEMPIFERSIEELLDSFPGAVVNRLLTVKKVLDRRVVAREMVQLNNTEVGNSFRAVVPPQFEFNYLSIQVDGIKYRSFDEIQWESLLLSRGLRYPLIAKAAVACGVKESHYMAIVLDVNQLVNLGQENQNTEGSIPSPMCVAQYYNHGGWVYKVYVIGGPVFIHRRPSIPDFSLDGAKDKQKVYWFDSLQGLPIDLISDSNSPTQAAVDYTSKAFQDACQIIATFIRKQLGLDIFGFDIIVVKDDSDKDSSDFDLVVVDVNFFPSFKEIPEAPRALRNLIKQIHQSNSKPC